MSNDMTVDELKELAEDLGIKKPGVGWPKCCPPNGNKDDIIKAIKKHGGSSGGGGGNGGVGGGCYGGSGSGGYEYHDMTVDELKELAEDHGIKKAGVGWPKCCPPNGNKDDIIKALKKHDGSGGGGGGGGGGGVSGLAHLMDVAQIGSLRFKPSKVIADLHYRRKDIVTFIREEGLDEDAVKHMYTQNHIYKSLNKSLSTGQLSKFQKRFAMLLGDAIYEIIEKLPKKVYRGVHLAEGELKEYKQAEGRVVYWYGFTSTTYEKAIAQGFGNAIFEIELEKGNRECVANLGNVSQFPEEKEVLVSANAGFLVEDVDVAKRYVKLVLVDNDYCPTWERD